MSRTSICCTVIFSISLIALVLLLKYSIDSYREGQDYKKTIIGIISSLLVVLLMLFTIKWTVGISLDNACLFIMLLPFLVISIIILSIYYLVKLISQYKKDGDLKKLKKNVAVIAVVMIIVIASIYITIEYIGTPDANQKFILELEQNETSEVELVLPNLKGYERYFPVERYNVVEGEGEVTCRRDGEYIKVTTSSKNFKMKYSEEAEMFSEYHGEWDFQYDKVSTEGYEEERPMMNISYSSEQNTTCHLTLQWNDFYSSKIIGAHAYEVEADTHIDGKTESIRVWVEKTHAP